jgi:regulator of protease activity HflC (stomatin/prohibitin superfamily)
MAIGIIVGIVLFVLACLAFVFCAICAENDKGAGAGFLGTIGALLVIAFILVPFSFHTVQTGELAVVKHLGKITHVREAGTNFDLWFINKYEKYDTKVQNVDITTLAYSSDAQTMDVTMTLQYQIMSDKVIDIATQYGSLEILQNRIQSIAIEKTKAVLSSYKAMDIIAQRAAISPAVEEAIKVAIGEDYFVKVNTVVLSNIDFSDAFESAVEDKMIAEQAKLKADYENEKLVAAAEADAAAKLKEAQAQIEIAQAAADAKLKEALAQKAIAEAEAAALLIKAEAEASANKIIAESVTQELLEKILAENWDGKLPDTCVGDGSGLGIILPTP